MITYKEKDKLATYILSIGLIDFNIKYKEGMNLAGADIQAKLDGGKGLLILN